MTEQKIKFGTSGFRGVIGDDCTKESMQRIGIAFRKLVEARAARAKIIVGYDNRFMGKQFAEWFCEAACSDTVKADLMTVAVPTPFIAYKAVIYDYGVIITASHNPYYYNGIKIILNGGRDADDKFCDELTRLIETTPSGRGSALTELEGEFLPTLVSNTEDYINKVVSLMDATVLKKSGVKVLFNPMHGSGNDIMQRIFKKIGVNYDVINENADAFFGGTLPAPYPHNLKKMIKQVVDGGYSFGFAFDGDGDRVTFIDADGAPFDCNYLSAVLYKYLIETKKQKGGFVKSALASSLAVRLCKKYGFELTETRVGFKYLGEALGATDALIAAEPGGMALKSVSLLKDGISTAAMVIDMVAAMGKSIGALVAETAMSVGFPSRCVEFAYPFARYRREELVAKLRTVALPEFGRNIIRREDYPDGYKVLFEGDYWAAARVSGTEDVVRFYAEMKTEADCNKVLSQLENFYNLKERQI